MTRYDDAQVRAWLAEHHPDLDPGMSHDGASMLARAELFSALSCVPRWRSASYPGDGAVVPAAVDLAPDRIQRAFSGVMKLAPEGSIVQLRRHEDRQGVRWSARVSILWCGVSLVREYDLGSDS